jgi:WD40 repeat protein
MLNILKFTSAGMEFVLDMSELTISSTNWLAISLRNGAAIVFHLNNTQQWQYLKPTDQPEETTPTATVSKQQGEDDEDNTSDLNRNLIKFTPDGQKLVVNGQNKQIYIYIPSDFELTKTYWQLQRIITVKKRASALDLTNEFLLIADKSGDVYKTDLSIDTNLVLTFDDCIMGHLSMLLDIAFIRTNENQEFILTADRDEKIRLSHYPNAYNIQGFCLGHTEFVSHVKLIDQNHILSASGDGENLFS